MKFHAAVIGSPISHSLSPEIFGFLASQLSGMELEYRAIDVHPQNLKARLYEFSQDPFFIGANVTLPHKEAVVSLAPAVSSLAKAVGAANVLHLQKGSWTAHNSDVFGVSESLRESGFQFYQSQALIIGAGGAARAAAAALAQESASTVDIYNRTYVRSQALAHELSTQFPQTSFFAVREPHELQNRTHDLILQSTPLGMQGMNSAPGLDFVTLFNSIAGQPLAFELIYRPEDTAFLRIARSRSMPTLGGLDMLAHQAIATWEIWFPNFPLPKGVSERLMQNLRIFLGREGKRQ